MPKYNYLLITRVDSSKKQNEAFLVILQTDLARTQKAIAGTAEQFLD